MTHRQTDDPDIDRPDINEGDGSLADTAHHPFSPLTLDANEFKDELTEFYLSEEQEQEKHCAEKRTVTIDAVCDT